MDLVYKAFTPLMDIMLFGIQPVWFAHGYLWIWYTDLLPPSWISCFLCTKFLWSANGCRWTLYTNPLPPSWISCVWVSDFLCSVNGFPWTRYATPYHPHGFHVVRYPSPMFCPCISMDLVHKAYTTLMDFMCFGTQWIPIFCPWVSMVLVHKACTTIHRFLWT